MIQLPKSPLRPSPTEFAGHPAAACLRPSEMRLRKHADYQRVYQTSRKQFSASMTWFLSSREETSVLPIVGPRVGLAAGKVLGKAHERNRIKRRMREAVRRHVHLLPSGADVILHPRRSVMTMDFVKLEAEILRIFRQAAAQLRETSVRPNSGRSTESGARPMA